MTIFRLYKEIFIKSSNWNIAVFRFCTPIQQRELIINISRFSSEADLTGAHLWMATRMKQHIPSLKLNIPRDPFSPTLCNPMECSVPCPSPSPRACSNSWPLSQWCHPTISSSVVPFFSCLNLSQHQGLFQWVSFLHEVAKVLGFQHQSFQWIFRTDFL